MVFMGSSKTDKAGRLTLIKEVKEVLELSEKDHVMFYLENGEIIIRKYIDDSPSSGQGETYAKFWDWYRKRKIEIDMVDDPDLKRDMTEDLEERRATIETLMEQQSRPDGTYVNKGGVDNLNRLNKG